MLTGEMTSMAAAIKFSPPPLPGRKRLGPKTVARLLRVILFSSLCSATLKANSKEEGIKDVANCTCMSCDVMDGTMTKANGQQTHFLKCLKRNTAVLKLTGGREWKRVTSDCSRASGSERPETENRKISKLYT